MGEQKTAPKKSTNQSTIVRDAMALFVITLVAGLLLGLVNQVTKEPILAAELTAKNEAYRKVFSEGKNFEEDETLTKKLEAASYSGAEIKEVLIAKDKDGNTLGYVMSLVSKEGYGGEISFAIGVKPDGVMTGLSVLSHSETAGLGANCTTDAFQSQFVGLVGPQVQYTKNGKSSDNEFDAISGATITSRAITNALNAGLAFLEENGCFTELS